MALFIPNGTYRIENVGRAGDKRFVSVHEDNLILARHSEGNDRPQKWVLRDQGNYGGPNFQLVSLQLAGNGVDDMGFFHVEIPTDGTLVNYDRLASNLKLEDVSDDNVSIRFTKGGRNLMLTAQAPDHETQVILANRDPENGRQQWRFIPV